ncbi:MAG: flagellar basal body P-ring formation chaperone FlgA [Nitrospirota bacterium]
MNKILIPRLSDSIKKSCFICHSEHPKGVRNLYQKAVRFLASLGMTKSEGLGMTRKNRSIWVIISSVLVILVSASFFSVPIAFSSSQGIEDVLKEYLRNNYPWSEIDINNLTVNNEMPGKQIEKIMIKKSPPGKTIFVLEFEDGKKITATANIKAYDHILVSRRAFKKGYYLQEDDVYTVLMDVRKIPNGALKDKDIEKVIGKPLLRSIIANMPLSSGMVSETSVVKKGQRVTLLVESEGLKIAAIGEMKEDSTVGKLVKAINLASKKIVKGLLINENTIKVGL